MSLSNKEIASRIVSYLSSLIRTGQVTEDYAESISVAIECIRDSFDLQEEVSADSDLATVLLANLNLEPEPKLSEKERELVNEQAIKLKLEGNKAVERENYKDAIDKYTRAIDLLKKNGLPVDRGYLSNKSLALTKSGRYEEACDDALACIKIDPTFSKGYSRLAEAKIGQNKYEDAMNAYKQVLDLEGNKATDTMKRDFEITKQKFETLNFSTHIDSGSATPISEAANKYPPKDEEIRTRSSLVKVDVPAEQTNTNEEHSTPNTNTPRFNIAQLIGNGIGTILNNPQVQLALSHFAQRNPDAARKVQEISNNPMFKMALSQLMDAANQSPEEFFKSEKFKNLVNSFIPGAL
ncbi:hypothetical protein NCAS_0D02670 [Naumovozyma castellii]|uniref:SGTA homodimerisation domain-containing protein n=1 Tax=Naumovozyma castellii TaxID=27288 RepID=G0VE57_NAUCA|nr:hypothetical protein NCAS_0D02670 [Naumovozyma castellii CBS 4309]CCC69848.1 hypothetical protein NCAS_0D02670 [Naumovozyma castellii CBS 4309]